MKLIQPQDIPRALLNPPVASVATVDIEALHQEQITRLKDALSIMEQERAHFLQQVFV